MPVSDPLEIKVGKSYKINDGPGEGKVGRVVSIFETQFGHVYGEVVLPEGGHMNVRQECLEEISS